MNRLFFILILLVSVNGFAVEVPDLYQSKLAVSSQEEEERLRVAPDVLRQVILKVVGDQALLESADISSILAQSNDLVDQYQYVRTNKIEDDVTEPDHLELKLTFKSDELNRALNQAGLVVWGPSRPESIIWFGIDRAGNRSIITPDENPRLADMLIQAADARGLPILFPLMDLEDQMQVTFTDLSAGFSQTVEQASVRYGSPLVVIVNAVFDQQGRVLINWQLKINSMTEQWQSRGEINTAIQSGIGTLADRMARQLTQPTTDSVKQKLVLHITGVEDYSDYLNVINYLKQLQYVSDVEVEGLVAESLTISLVFKGDIDMFNRLLNVEKKLVPELYSPTDTLNYRLVD